MPDQPDTEDVRDKATENTRQQAGEPQVDVGSLDQAEHDERLKQLQQDRLERKKYAEKIFLLIVIWLGVIISLLFLQGFCNLLRTSPDCQPCFFLSDAVLIATVTTTTASVVALFVLVAKYLYPKRP
ncbi:MAG: hypothetical protein OXL36_16775 [Bryobacterales bacterium]|nr:hypothetical protein [Bryobacterales bacterium]MDE0296102.1 hypothetical protein [Bryobacterales bacterium]